MSDISKEYGGALFDLACDEEIDLELLNELLVLNDIFDKNNKYLRFLSTPDIPKSERVAAVSEAFDGKVHEYISSFIKILTERGHASHIPECIAEYEKLYYERKGLLIARVESAVELTNEQKNAIMEKLERKLGNEIALKCKVDPSLIGGIRVLVKDSLFEGSVKSKLSKLKKDLSSVTL